MSVPSWAKEAVWYQIFPERFRRGCQNNDPTSEDIGESCLEGWRIREWGSDWYEMDDWESEIFGDFYKSVYKRRYGGDLQGIIDKLDYLKDLGINAIYLNPVFRAPSLHKYDGESFHHVDETFGPDPDGDREILEKAHETEDSSTWVWTSADRKLLEVIGEVHKRGMRIILDGVFNHSGRGFFAFKDILKNGRKSRFAGWYSIKKWGGEKSKRFTYNGWCGHQTLPEFAKTENGMNDEYSKYVFDITKRWMAPNGDVGAGIDGWRLDVAICIPHEFWKKWRKHVKSINPEAYLVAEIVDIRPDFLKGDEFDAFMNYPFAYAMTEYFIDKKSKIPPSEFDRRLKHLRESYPHEITSVMQNLMSSHDTPRLRSIIVNPDIHYRNFSRFFERSKLEKNHSYRIDRGDESHRMIHKLIAIFQMTYIGAPVIYYGDEVGMSGANDPDCRKPMVWDDVEYDDEIAHPIHGFRRPPEKNRPERDLLEHYRKMINIRNSCKALRFGDFITFIADDRRELFGFSREYEGERVYVVFNKSGNSSCVEIPVFGNSAKFFVDVLNEGRKFKAEPGRDFINVSVEPGWAAILVES